MKSILESLQKANPIDITYLTIFENIETLSNLNNN